VVLDHSDDLRGPVDIDAQCAVLGKPSSQPRACSRVGSRPINGAQPDEAAHVEIVGVAPAALEADRRPLAHRFLGPELL
jgi:hypothetical protein